MPSWQFGDRGQGFYCAAKNKRVKRMRKIYVGQEEKNMADRKIILWGDRKDVMAFCQKHQMDDVAYVIGFDMERVGEEIPLYREMKTISDAAILNE